MNLNPPNDSVLISKQKERQLIRIQAEHMVIKPKLKIYEDSVYFLYNRLVKDSMALNILQTRTVRLQHENINLEFQYSKLNIIHSHQRKLLVDRDQQVKRLKKRLQKTFISRQERKVYHVSIAALIGMYFVVNLAQIIVN